MSLDASLASETVTSERCCNTRQNNSQERIDCHKSTPPSLSQMIRQC
jgi:hypothetical protein